MNTSGYLNTQSQNLGWTCPKCDKCYSPTTVECVKCNSPKVGTVVSNAESFPSNIGGGVTTSVTIRG